MIEFVSWDELVQKLLSLGYGEQIELQNKNDNICTITLFGSPMREIYDVKTENDSFFVTKDSMPNKGMYFYKWLIRNSWMSYKVINNSSGISVYKNGAYVIKREAIKSLKGVL